MLARPTSPPARCPVLVLLMVIVLVGAGLLTSPARAERSSVVGLGDSVPAGTACGCSSYVALIAAALARRSGSPVSARNLATRGATTASLLAQVRTPSASATLSDAAVTIVTVGANDFAEGSVTTAACAPAAGLGCYRGGLVRLRRTLDAVLARVRLLQAGERTTVLVTGYWNVFKDGAVGRARGAAYVAGSDALTRAANRVIAASARGAGVRYVDVYRPFKGVSGTLDDTALLAADGDHPNAAGHRRIAAVLLASVPVPGAH